MHGKEREPGLDQEGPVGHPGWCSRPYFCQLFYQLGTSPRGRSRENPRSRLHQSRSFSCGSNSLGRSRISKVWYQRMVLHVSASTRASLRQVLCQKAKGTCTHAQLERSFHGPAFPPALSKTGVLEPQRMLFYT